jgi:alkylation response protein AidB-like acyl-CoA dehydrogenase
MNLLARTDPDAPKHKGISYFMVDMKSSGINVRPLTNIVGDDEFTEVFFDNVRVPNENLLGEENRGWYLATTTLDFERSNIASTTHLVLTVEDLASWAREHRGQPGCALESNATLRYEIAERYVEAQIARLMSYRIISMQLAGQLPNKESSVAKLYASELEQRIAITGLKTVGMYGQLLEPSETLQAARMYLYAVAITIGGGTSEIQRNIIAMRGLGMPRG